MNQIKYNRNNETSSLFNVTQEIPWFFCIYDVFYKKIGICSKMRPENDALFLSGVFNFSTDRIFGYKFLKIFEFFFR